MKLFSFLWKTSVATSTITATIIKRFMKDPNKLPRIYLEKNKLITGTSLQLNPDILHYLKNVLRLKTGDYFRSFNENDGEYLCLFEQPDGIITSDNTNRNSNNKSIRGNSNYKDNPIVAEKLKDPILNSSYKQIIINNQPINLSFSLYFVPIKKARLKQMLESCTELGVHSFIPVITQNMNNEYKDFESFQKLFIESVEQSEQFFIPKIHAPIQLTDLLNNWNSLKDRSNSNNKNKNGKIDISSNNIHTSHLYICRERMVGAEGMDQSFTTAIHKSLRSSITAVNAAIHPDRYITTNKPNHDADNIDNNDTIINETSRKNSITNSSSSSSSQFPSSLHCGILIGPEGGFTQQELSLLEQPEYSDLIHFVSLGSSVLRAETAAVCAVSIFMDTITSFENHNRNNSDDDDDDDDDAKNMLRNDNKDTTTSTTTTATNTIPTAVIINANDSDEEIKNSQSIQPSSNPTIKHGLIRRRTRPRITKSN